MFLSIPWFCFSLLSFPIYCNSPKTFFSGGIEKLWGITFTFCFWERRNSCVDYPLQLVLLIFQIKVNSIAIVRMRSMDRGPEHTINRGFYVAEGAKMCSVEQVCLFILSVFFLGLGAIYHPTIKVAKVRLVVVNHWALSHADKTQFQPRRSKLD